MALPEDGLKKKNSFGDAAAVAGDPGASLVRQARPSQNSPTNTWPGNQPAKDIYGARRAAPVPNPVAADPQAAADRAAIGGVWEGVKGFNAKAGAAIADVASLPVRGAVGAYDTAVVRPMRAAGINAAYLSPAVTPAGANPESMTPFYDRLRAGESAAPGTPAAAPAPLSAAAKPSLAVNPSDAFAGPVMGYQPTNPLNQPSTTPETATTGNVTRVGNSYSAAGPVSGDITVNGRTPGGGFMSMPSGNAGLSSLAQPAGFAPSAGSPAPRNGGAISAQNMNAAQAMSDREGLASYALAKQQIDNEASAKRNDPRQMLLDQLQGKRLNKNGAAVLAQLAGADTQERNSALGYSVGQENNRLRRDEFNREGVAVDFKNDALLQLQKAQQAVQSAKTPEERKAASDTLLAMQGKTESAKDNVITLGGGQEWDAAAGAMRNVPQRAIDIRTGREIGGLPSGQNPQLPPGMKRQIGTANGRPVYEDANGKTVVAKG